MMSRLAGIALTIVLVLGTGGWLRAQSVASGVAERADNLPLEPTRTVRFTTDEGTWMSVDVSPDGRTLVFDLLGDIYTLPIEGGKARRISGGMAWETDPRFSPDGKRILFLSDRDGAQNLWTMAADGSDLRPVTRGLQALENSIGPQWVAPMWMPGGRAIAVSRGQAVAGNYTRDLYVYDLAGGEGRPVGIADPAMGSAAISPDGRTVYYHVRTECSHLPACWVIKRFDVETKRAVAITPSTGLAFNPAVSPDGRLLAYATRIDTLTYLVVRDLASGRDRLLPGPVQEDLVWAFHHDLFPGYAFTPDSRSIVVTAGGKLWRVGVEDGRRTPIPFTAEVEQHLGPLVRSEYTEADSLVTMSQLRWPRPSPDGKWIVFQSLDRIWAYERATGKVRKLTDGPGVDEQPLWSPDGRHIAFVRWDPAKGGDVHRLAATERCLRGGGCTEENLTKRPGYYERLGYTPDGARLIAIRGSDRGAPEGLDVVSFPATGGEIRKVADFDAGQIVYGYPHQWPQFVRGEGKAYYFQNGRMQALDLGRGSWETAFAVAVVEGWSSVRDLFLSPDASRALVLDESGVRLLTFPRPGHFPDTVRLRDHEPAMDRLIDPLGGDYGGWFPDGRRFYYALGHTIFVHDLDEERKQGAGYRPERIDIRLQVPRDRAQGTVALRGARIITMQGERVIERGDVVVRDGRIAAVGESGSIAIPAGAKVIDVSGKTILPGYFDLHAHMGMATRDRDGIHDPQPYHLLNYFAYGITTIRDPAPYALSTFAYQDKVAAGEAVGPRFFSTGTPIFRTHPRIRDQEQARAVVRRYSSEFLDARTIKEYEVGDRIMRQWIAIAAREHGLTPTAEASLFYSMTHVLDGYAGVEHYYMFPSPIYKDVAMLVARSGTAYDPTLVTGAGLVGGNYFNRRYDIHGEPKLQRFMPHEELDGASSNSGNASGWYRDELYRFQQLARDAKKIIDEGGVVVMGSHDGVTGLQGHFELWAIASGGVRPIDVLRVGTLNGAIALGLDKELGSIEVGKLADLQILDKNPLEDIKNTNSVRYVMKAGRLYDAYTLAELWPRQKSLGPLWWAEGVMERIAIFP